VLSKSGGQGSNGYLNRVRMGKASRMQLSSIGSLELLWHVESLRVSPALVNRMSASCPGKMLDVSARQDALVEPVNTRSAARPFGLERR
jgi:hypothetical protein